MNNTNQTAFTAGPLSLRSLALGSLSRPQGRPSDGVDRTLSQGERVSLSLASRLGEDDAEFIVNADPMRRVRFSQFSSVFVTEAADALYCGTLSCDEGDLSLASMACEDFISLVSGRIFSVETASGMYAVDTAVAARRVGGTMADVLSYIGDALASGRFDEVSGLTVPAPCWSLREEGRL